MIDRTLAHLSDMLGFVRELRALVGATALETYHGQRVLNLAVETLYRTITTELASVERALVEHLARRGGDG